MTSQVLVVGSIKEGDREPMTLAATRCETTLLFAQSAQRAVAKLHAGQERPMCVLAGGDVDVRQLVDGIRDDAELFSTSVLVLLHRATNDLYREAYLAGADDVLLASDAGGLTRRLANLKQGCTRERPAATLGRAVVVSRDEVSRRRLGRTLRQVGFEVEYASGLGEIERLQAQGKAANFAVCTASKSSADAAYRGTEQGNVGQVAGVPVLFLTPDVNDDSSSLDDQIVDVTARMLFFADEQAKAQFKDRRASARKLYSSISSFREVGSLQPNYAVTYNVSKEGLYIRTLDPPRAQSTVWLEMRAPRSETPIHLRARAMWQRLPGSGQGLMPPGFGLQIDAAQCPKGDLEAYGEGYALLAE